MILLWRFSGFATTLVAGYLVAHVIVLGRFFDWLIAHGRAAVLSDAYSVFRVEGDPVTPYIGTFVAQFALSLLLAIAVLRCRRQAGARPVATAILAALCLPLTFLLFGVSGFDAIEDAVMSASDLSPPTLGRWLALNVPMHATIAGLYVVAAALLVFGEPLGRSSDL